MEPLIPDLPFSASMLVGMLICLEIGRRLGMRSLAKDPQGAMAGLGVVHGAVFSLYGLLIAFTFSGAPSRFDTRRHLAEQEANAIGTAYLRLDLLPAESQPALRDLFRKYVDSRVKTFRDLQSHEEAMAMGELAKSEKLQQDIWIEAVRVFRLAPPNLGPLILNPLNEMMDITSTYSMAMRIHPPLIIFELLFFLALICSLLAGYGMAASKDRSWLHVASFSIVAVVTVFVILEIEYPRTGFFHLENANDQILVNLRAVMK
jgi:hypothetical protein